jgi:hypothetical protein
MYSKTMNATVSFKYGTFKSSILTEDIKLCAANAEFLSVSILSQ